MTGMNRDQEKEPLYIEGTDKRSTDSAHPVPLCCQRCAHYRPTFFLKIGLECAAFGTVAGVLDDKCGFYAPK